jgi:hypothetical protein
MTNSLESIRKFVTGEDTPTVKELYMLALQSAAQSLIEAGNNSNYFLLNIQPKLTNIEEVFLIAAKSKLADLFRFNQVILYQVIELAMRESVIGEDPNILLQLSSEGKLIPPSEEEINLAVSSQFANDALVKELLEKNVINLTLSFKQ